MTKDEAAEFVRMVSEAWNPPLTNTQEQLWRDLCEPLDAKVAFAVLSEMFKTEKFRVSVPDFKDAYHRKLRDLTPVAPSTPEDRDEMPEWVGGWFLARQEGDHRLWPEEQIGARKLHDWWVNNEEGEGPSGYEWEQLVADQGLMPQEDRVEYMRRHREGEGPRTAEELAQGLAG